MVASGPDMETIENLVVDYIQRPSCIIMVTVACESKCRVDAAVHNLTPMSSADWENQRGFDLAQKHDPEGRRTIGKRSQTVFLNRILE